MSVSKRVLEDTELCERIVYLYQTQKLTKLDIARDTSKSYSIVSFVLKQHLPAAELKRLRSLMHSRAKKGSKNPMYGVQTAAARIKRRGYAGVWNGKGYTMEHRLVAAEMLGLPELPPHLVVHHIDGDRTHNVPDNLAIATRRGHGRMHREVLGVLSLWEKETYGTSLLQEIIRTLPEV